MPPAVWYGKLARKAQVLVLDFLGVSPCGRIPCLSDRNLSIGQDFYSLGALCISVARRISSCKKL